MKTQRPPLNTLLQVRYHGESWFIAKSRPHRGPRSGGNWVDESGVKLVNQKVYAWREIVG